VLIHLKSANPRYQDGTGQSHENSKILLGNKELLLYEEGNFFSKMTGADCVPFFQQQHHRLKKLPG
jgi:hypothetical protein